MNYEFAMYISDFCFVAFFILYLVFKSHIKFIKQGGMTGQEPPVAIAAKTRWARLFFWLSILSFLVMVVSLIFGLKQ